MYIKEENKYSGITVQSYMSKIYIQMKVAGFSQCLHYFLPNLKSDTDANCWVFRSFL